MLLIYSEINKEPLDSKIRRIVRMTWAANLFFIVHAAAEGTLAVTLFVYWRRHHAFEVGSVRFGRSVGRSVSRDSSRRGAREEERDDGCGATTMRTTQDRDGQWPRRPAWCGWVDGHRGADDDDAHRVAAPRPSRDGRVRAMTPRRRPAIRRRRRRRSSSPQLVLGDALWTAYVAVKHVSEVVLA